MFFFCKLYFKKKEGEKERKEGRKKEKGKERTWYKQALHVSGDCFLNGCVSHRKTFELHAGSSENNDLGNCKENSLCESHLIQWEQVEAPN